MSMVIMNIYVQMDILARTAILVRLVTMLMVVIYVLMDGLARTVMLVSNAKFHTSNSSI